MKYKEAMAGIDKKQLEEAVEEDYQKFEKWCACLRLSELAVLKNAKLLDANNLGDEEECDWKLWSNSERLRL